MTITAPEPDPHARASAAVVDAAAVADGGDPSAPARDEPLALPDAGVALRAGRPASSCGLDRPVRRLRVAPPVQLELVSEREGPRPEVVWASLPQRSREAVLVLLARLIGTGAVEEEIEQEEGVA